MGRGRKVNLVASFSAYLSRLTFLLVILIVMGCTILPIRVAIVFTPTPFPSLTPTLTLSATPTSILFPTVTRFPSATPTFTPFPAPTRLPSVTPTSTPFPTVTPVPSPTFTATPSPQIKYVVIISLDGLRPDALEQANTPILDDLRTKGAYSAAAKSVLPSVTLVNHASMLGGMSPTKHGIYWNEDNPNLGLINGPTLFSVAHQAGLSTAMIVGKSKFRHLVLPDSVDIYDLAGYFDRQVVNHALKVIQAGLPNVLFIHLPNIDSTGHALGWMSPGQLLAIYEADSLVGEIVTALDEGHYLNQTLLIITADHGGNGLKHGSDSVEDTTVPWLAIGTGVPPRILKTHPVMYDTAATALYALKLPIPPEWDGRPILEIFEK